MTLKTILFLYYSYFMLNDFRQLPGQFFREKILQFITINAVVFLEVGSISQLYGILSNNREVRERLGRNLSELNSAINYYNSIILAILSLLLLFLTIGMMYRDEKVRRLFCSIVLIALPFAVVEFYLINVQRNQGSGPLLFLGGVIFMGIVYGLISKIYSSNRMKLFFAAPNKQRIRN